MKIASVPLYTLLLFAAAFTRPTPLLACPIELMANPNPGGGWEVRWLDVPGADGYRVDTWNDYTGLRYSTPHPRSGPGEQVVHLNRTYNVDRNLSIQIFALDFADRPTLPGEPEADPRVLCTATKSLLFKADPAFAAATRKWIIPLVGRAAGKEGARFRTSLRLTTYETSTQRGELVFHPLGGGAPKTVPYDFAGGDGILVFDDLMAAFEANGLGSVDIVPDAEGDVRAPEAEVRLYNEAAGGAVGTFSHSLAARDYIDDPDRARIQFRAPQRGVRLNLGFRTLAESTVAFFLSDRNGNAKAQRWLNLVAADRVHLESAESIFGVPVEPGDRVGINVTWGAAIPFYTLTDNTTNDTHIEIAPAETVQMFTFRVLGGFRSEDGEP